VSEQDDAKGLVAVTGAAGHIGANLVRSLLVQGRRVRALVREHMAGIVGLPVEVVRCDVTDGEACRRALAGARIVYHLAARISVGWDPPGRVETVNVGGTQKVVEACLACGVERLVHFSSIHAFSADPVDGVIDESRPLVQNQPHALVYDRTKAEGERRGSAWAGCRHRESLVGDRSLRLCALGHGGGAARPCSRSLSRPGGRGRLQLGRRA
jgi:nucleoside-diphosphate-sugar epimerase